MTPDERASELMKMPLDKINVDIKIYIGNFLIRRSTTKQFYEGFKQYAKEVEGLK